MTKEELRRKITELLAEFEKTNPRVRVSYLSLIPLDYHDVARKKLIKIMKVEIIVDDLEDRCWNLEDYKNA